MSNKSNRNYGIFEEVTFINEGIIDALGIITLTYLGLPLMIVAGCAIGSTISKAANTSAIKSGLSKLSKHDNVKEFYKKMKPVRYISVDKLLDRLDIEEDEKNKYKYKSVTRAIIEDNSGNIMAYAVVENHSSYAFHIADKSIKTSTELNNFVKATFEFHFGIIGPGIKHIAGLKDGSSFKNKSNKESDMIKNISAKTLSDDDKLQANRLADKLVTQIISKIRGALSSSYYIDIERTSKRDKGSIAYMYIVLKEYADGKIEDWDNVKIAMEDMSKDLEKKITPIFKSFGFDITADTDITENPYISIIGDNSDKYPYFKVELGQPYDEKYDSCYYTIHIDLKRNI